MTSAQVLRKADVTAAVAAIGVRVPPNTRTAADVPELHGPWSAAVATGLLRIGDGMVTSGHALEGWPPGDAALLDAWLAGLRAVCNALADPGQEASFTGMLVCALALLTVLEDEEVPTGKELWHAVLEESDDLCDTYDLDLVPAAAMRRAGLAGGSRLGGMVALLAGFGAVTGDADRPVITPLGRWAARRLEEALPRAAEPEISAAELIAEVAESGDAVQRLEAASEWLEQHQPREILEAAESMSPLLRTVAADLVEMLGEDAVPAWREFTAAPHVGPHARYALCAWGQGPEPGERDLQWALTEFTASGVPRSVDQGVQLKVTLKRATPAIWRSVRLPIIATLGDLHQVIQLLFGWDGDHLHAFRVGRRAYSDPFFTLEDAADEDDIRIRDACRPGVTIGYEYDFGASWQHEITSQKAFTLDPDQLYPVCVAYQGDSPVEYPSEENPQEPEPFSLTEVNRKLARLGR